MASTDNWHVNALVEATPISGPACRYTPASVSRAIELATTFTRPNTSAPRRRASCTAASVSAVSPDWLIASTAVWESRIGLRYRNSLAYSTSTGRRARVSMTYSATSAACQEVPHATRIKRSIRARSRSNGARPPSTTSPSAGLSRPRRALATESGCS